jgi:hypothetical protein
MRGSFVENLFSVLFNFIGLMIVSEIIQRLQINVYFAPLVYIFMGSILMTTLLILLKKENELIESKKFLIFIFVLHTIVALICYQFKLSQNIVGYFGLAYPIFFFYFKKRVPKKQP